MFVTEPTVDVVALINVDEDVVTAVSPVAEADSIGVHVLVVSFERVIVADDPGGIYVITSNKNDWTVTTEAEMFTK